MILCEGVIGIYICKKIPVMLIFVILIAGVSFIIYRSCAVRAADAELTEFADIPVLMYHSIADRPSRAGDYLILPDLFYSDMKYLSEHGYKTVTAAQTLEYAKNGGDFPDKPIIVTFDDGFLNNLTYALPVFEEFNMCGTVNIVGSYCVRSAEYDDHNPNYAYLTNEEIIELAESGRFEIGAHTYDMHGMNGRQGCRRNYNESEEDYFAALSEDCRLENEYLLTECGMVTDVFAYPYGYISKGSGDVLYKNGYKVLFTCYERHNIIEPCSVEEGEPLYLDRYNRAYGLSSEDFMEKAGIL